MLSNTVLAPLCRFPPEKKVKDCKSVQKVGFILASWHYKCYFWNSNGLIAQAPQLHRHHWRFPCKGWGTCADRGPGQGEPREGRYSWGQTGLGAALPPVPDYLCLPGSRVLAQAKTKAEICSFCHKQSLALLSHSPVVFVRGVTPKTVLCVCSFSSPRTVIV